MIWTNTGTVGLAVVESKLNKDKSRVQAVVASAEIKQWRQWVKLVGWLAAWRPSNRPSEAPSQPGQTDLLPHLHVPPQSERSCRSNLVTISSQSQDAETRSTDPCTDPHRLGGLVVKASASGAEDPGFESRLRRDFSGSSYTSDLNIGTPVATLPGAWRYRISTGTGRPGVSILWLGEIDSLICNFYLSVAARKIVWADPSLRYTRMLLGR